MKITLQPTDYVIIRVKTKSKQDHCNFALLQLSTEWDLIMNQRLIALRPFRSDPHFYCHTYWDSPLNYYRCARQSAIGRIINYLEMDQETWAFVALDDPEEPARLKLPDTELDTHMLMINAEGNAFYMCFDKDSAEEYSTESFSLREILHERLI